MTSKKKRQRGSRTHGGGSQKNRRGAGHRGGRGAAGRDKHEFHNYEPLGKSGFSRPASTQEDVFEVDVRELDENAGTYVAEGRAEEMDGAIAIDVREAFEGAEDADVVKVLGGGQVRNELSVQADAFSETAIEKIEAAGGAAELTDLGKERQAATDEDEDDEA
jgi:large subunit ribosomal protein L15